MTDLTEVFSPNKARESLLKKKAKIQERIDKIMEKVLPLQADLTMYDKMITAIDERDGVAVIADIEVK
jgi:hypothetical protein